MSEAIFCELTDRALVRVAGEDSAGFLGGLVTCDVTRLAPGGIAHGALLTPQGKILFDFFIVGLPGGFMLDCPAALAEDLVRRLTFYKLRSRVEIGPMDARTSVFAIWSDGAITPGDVVADGIMVVDPRLPGLGLRGYLRRAPEGSATASLPEWHARRIRHGMPEGGLDFAFGDAFPHEALMDRTGGVDFRKGCYVGQEVVSRMQHRATARSRIVMVEGDGELPGPGTEILSGGKAIGSMGSHAGGNGLAMIRLDRTEASDGDSRHALAGTLPVRLRLPPWAGLSWPDA